MTISKTTRIPRCGHMAILALVSALSSSAIAQQSIESVSDPTPSAAQPSPQAQGPLSKPPKEGFWGRVNPFAGKKWVHRQIDPMQGQLDELDELNTKNGKDIQDVDARAQAGIHKAQSTADEANQTATAAGQQAQQAGNLAGQANSRVNLLTGKVSGLDQYELKDAISVSFRPGTAVLTVVAKKQLDDLAAELVGHQGYLLEMQAHSPSPGESGIQSSDRLAEAVKRYLVTQHEIPVYRMHSVALGNAPDASAGESRPTRSSYVQLRLMENSLAAQDRPTPRIGLSQTGAVQP